MPGITTWNVSGQRLSGTDARPAGAPRATIVALHGGGYSAGYWDHPLDPAASLLTLGLALGYRVVAIDRPGYGASHGLVRDSVRADRQTEIVLDLINMLRTGSDTGSAVFLIGHSMGAVLALHMAASARAGAIAGLDISGLPFVFDEALADKQQLASLDFLPGNSREFRRALFYGPDGTFDADMIAAEERLIRPIPAAEIIDAVECPVSTTVLAPKITVPVRITRAESDVSSGGGARDSRAAAPCSRQRRESSWPGSGPAVTTSACTTSPAPTTCAPSRSSTRRSATPSPRARLASLCPGCSRALPGDVDRDLPGGDHLARCGAEGLCLGEMHAAPAPRAVSDREQVLAGRDGQVLDGHRDRGQAAAFGEVVAGHHRARGRGVKQGRDHPAVENAGVRAELVRVRQEQLDGLGVPLPDLKGAVPVERHALGPVLAEPIPPSFLLASRQYVVSQPSSSCACLSVYRGHTLIYE